MPMWVGDPIDKVDPSGPDWHHVFPEANYRQYSIPAQAVFETSTIETPEKHRWSSGHFGYNRATAELAERFGTIAESFAALEDHYCGTGVARISSPAPLMLVRRVPSPEKFRLRGVRSFVPLGFESACCSKVPCES